MKKINYLAIGLISLFVFNNKVLAAGSISTTAQQVYSGDSFTVTASVSGVASWEIHVSASGPVSGCVINAADATETATNGSKSYSATCTATGSGTITVNLSGNAADENANRENLSGSRTVQVVARPVQTNNNTKTNTTTRNNNNNNNNTTTKKDTKSSDTKLEEFGVKSYKVSPEFSNDKNDYTLSVPNSIDKIEIYASRKSNKQTVSGLGEKEVKEGENKFSIVVTAEDGSKRTINLTVTVDAKPIVIKVDNSEYNLIKNKEELPVLDIEHEDMTLTIEEQEIPAYRIDKIGYVLVGLKDAEGNVNLYKFDSFKNEEKDPEYHLFKYLKSTGILFVKKDFSKNKIPKNYKKYVEEINGEKIEVYKLSKNSKYSLIYGLNLETGKENLYRYDSKEKTLQIFEREEAKVLEAKVLRREKLILILAGVVVILVLFTTIGFTKKPKIKVIEKEVEHDNTLTKKDIRKIEKDTKKQEKINRKRQRKGEPDM